MEKRILLASAIVLGITGVWGTPADSAQNRMSITPLLKLSAQYDSNFYKTPTDEENAWTYMVQPGFEAEIETERSHASLYYTLDAFYYSGLEQDLDYVGHTFTFDTGTRTRSDALHLNLRDTYRRTRNPSELEYLNNLVSTNEFSVNKFDPEIIYNFGLSSFRLAYGNVWIDYHESGFGEDSTENRGIGEWKYHFNRANALGVNYQIWTQDYDGSSSDYDAQQGKVVYTRQNRMLRLEAGAGWQSREFDEAGLDDIDGFVGDIMLQAIGLKNWDMTLRLDRNFNDYGTEGDYYSATKLAFTANHEFSEVLLGRFYGAYMNSDFEFVDREDDTWNMEVSLGYTLTRWMAVSGAVGAESRNSDLAAAEYDNFYGFAGLTFSYPIGTGTPVISPSPYNR